MKKIGLTILIISILIGGYFFFKIADKQVQKTNDIEQYIKKENIPTSKPSQEDESNPKEEEDESVGEKIAKTVTEVVENTINFFSKSELRVVAIGDSLTQGVGDQFDNEGYVGILEDRLVNKDGEHLEIANYGKRGNRTDHLLKRLDDKEITKSLKEADIILVTIGANDIMKIVKENFLSLSYDDFTVEQKAYQARLTEIFNNIRKKNPFAHIYLVGLYNPFEQYFGDIPELEKIVDDWNWIGKSVVESYDRSTFIPTKDIFADQEKNLFSDDHFHPNHRGYKLLADRVLEYMKKTYGNS